VQRLSCTSEGAGARRRKTGNRLWLALEPVGEWMIIVFVTPKKEVGNLKG